MTAPVPMGNNAPMDFGKLIEGAGGAGKVALASGGAVSRPHLANIAAGRKRLTPDVVAAIRPQFPDVSEGEWLAWLLEHDEGDATDAA